MSSENYKISGFPTYCPNPPLPRPSNLSITNQTWTPNQTTFKSMNISSQSFLNSPRPAVNLPYELKSLMVPASGKNEIAPKFKVSLAMPSLDFSFKCSPPPLFANGTLTADSFSKRKTEQSYHVKPDSPRYTATEKLFFQAFDSFSRWTNQQPPLSLVLPETRELPLSQSQVDSAVFNNTPMISFQANCWVQVKNGTGPNNRSVTSIEIKVTSVTIDFFDPLKRSMAELTRVERNRISEKTRECEISVRDRRNRYIARKLSGDAERPLSRFVSIAGKMGPGNSLEIDISRYSWGKNLEWQMKEILGLRPDAVLEKFSNALKVCRSLDADLVREVLPLEGAFLNKSLSIRTNTSNSSTAKSTNLPETRLDQLMQALKEEYALRTAKNRTRTFSTAGISLPNIGIGGINGILTGPGGADSHANYFTELAGGISINWTYNHTNGPFDFIEVFAMNYFGISPNTARELQDIWTSFHEKHLDNPHIKYLHFCHSQGAIHTRNALVTLPKEIRDRVIVVAIAPAAIVPKNLCFNSSNYACKGDVVPLGDMFFAGLLNPNECRPSKLEEMTLQNHEELILLDAIPGNGSRHDLQYLIFKKPLTDHLDDYIGKNGIY